jgi:hypothetical protein
MGVKLNISANPKNSKKFRPYDLGLSRKMRSALERFFDDRNRLEE